MDRLGIDVPRTSLALVCTVSDFSEIFDVPVLLSKRPALVGSACACASRGLLVIAYASHDVPVLPP